MKKFRKLIPAFCMLLVSAILLGTSTYAWFSMNKTVTAAGLTVSANSDFTYLLISDTEGGTKATNYNGTSMTLNPATASLIPTSHKNFGTLGTDNTVLAVDSGNLKYWFIKQGDAPSASTSTGTEQAIASSDVAKHIYSDDLYINLAPQSDAADKIVPSVTLKVAAVNGAASTADVGALRVLLVCGTTTIEFDLGTATKTIEEDFSTTYKINSTTALITNLTYGADSEKKVELYVYYDGADEIIYNNNFANIGGGALTVTFDVMDN